MYIEQSGDTDPRGEKTGELLNFTLSSTEYGVFFRFILTAYSLLSE